MNQTIESIYKRRSIRNYLETPVDDTTVDILLRAAMAAPSAMNGRPWHFVVVSDTKVLNALRGASPFSHMNAPCSIVVCANLGLLHRTALQKFWEQDCSAAVENLLIAATSLGLGTVWCGIHPISRLENRVRETLNLPDNVVPFAQVFVGFPAEEKPARTQYEARKVSRDTFDRAWEIKSEPQ